MVLTQEAPVQQPDNQPERNPRKKRSIRTIVGIVAVSGVVVGGSIAGIFVAEGAQKGKAPEPKSDKDNSQTSTEKGGKSTSATKSSGSESIQQSIENNSLKSGQSLQGLSENIVNEFSSWEMADTKEITSQWLAQVKKTENGSDAARIAFEQNMAAQEGAIYGPALFGADYLTNPAIQDVYKNEVALDAINMDLVMDTTGPQLAAKGIETYKASRTFNSAVLEVPAPPTGRGFNIVVTDHNNAATVISEGVTNIAATPASLAVNGSQETFYLKTQAQGADEIITSADSN
jgi:hypothetical protein